MYIFLSTRKYIYRNEMNIAQNIIPNVKFASYLNLKILFKTYIFENQKTYGCTKRKNRIVPWYLTVVIIAKLIAVSWEQFPRSHNECLTSEVFEQLALDQLDHEVMLDETAEITVMKETNVYR